MKYIQIKLKPGKDESLRRFHPWVFSGAIQSMTGQPEEGDIVEVCNNRGEFIALGHYQIGSITVRILTFEKENIDLEFYKTRLRAAYDVRYSVGLIEEGYNNTYRLVHGEGDYLPGLIIDIYDKTAVMQAHSPGMHYARHLLAQALQEVMGESLKSVFYKSETTLPYKAQLDPTNEYLIGDDCGNIATERGLKFYVDWLKGQKTGFFVDQRENRALLERYAHDRTVLNMFCYTGGFSFAAMRGGAKLVHSVDSSSKAIDLTNKNVELNFPGDTRHKAFAEDAFKFLEQMGDRYNLIVLDPPAFAKHKNVLHNALQGYRKLNALAFEKSNPEDCSLRSLVLRL